MKLRILLAALLATAFAAGEAFSQADGIIRITSDPEATLSDVTFCVGIPTTLYISVFRRLTAGGSAPIPVDGLPASWSAIATQPGRHRRDRRSVRRSRVPRLQTDQS
jgi:hypothetical protein